MSSYLKILIIFMSSGCAVSAKSQSFDFQRDYEVGESLGYQLNTINIHNNEFHSSTVAHSNQMVIDVNGVPTEKISWNDLSKTTINGVENLNSDAKSVSPYTISLHPEGELDLPPLDTCNMIGKIADLNTFYVAVSQKVGVQHLSQVGDSFVNEEPVIGDWGGTCNIVKGQDCIQISVSLKELSESHAVVVTEFSPPSDKCENFSFLKPFMEAPVEEGVVNNFQQIRKQGDIHTAMWGVESFTITSHINRNSGVIEKAYMDNTLNLQMKVGCDSNLENCDATVPFKIQRKLGLILKTTI